jgi:hypothetical protein
MKEKYHICAEKEGEKTVPMIRKSVGFYVI